MVLLTHGGEVDETLDKEGGGTELLLSFRPWRKECIPGPPPGVGMAHIPTGSRPPIWRSQKMLLPDLSTLSDVWTRLKEEARNSFLLGGNCHCCHSLLFVAASTRLPVIAGKGITRGSRRGTCPRRYARVVVQHEKVVTSGSFLEDPAGGVTLSIPSPFPFLEGALFQKRTSTREGTR